MGILGDGLSRLDAKLRLPFPHPQVNPELKGHFEEKGFHFVGQDVEGERMEVIELDGKCLGKGPLLGSNA